MQRRRIVVAVDFSEPSVRAVRWVATVFAPGAELVLTHVIDRAEPSAILEELAPPTNVLEITARRGAEQKLGDISVQFGANRSRIDVRHGPVADGVVATARDVHAAAIVVGADHEQGDLWNRLSGTAERIIARSSVPVLLAANPGPTPPTHVLAATDGSEKSTAVDDWAQRLATRFGALWTRFTVGGPSVPTESLVAAGEHVIALEPATTSVATFGEPGHEILAAAARYDTGLIVVGRHASVTKEVLRGARCPVLVVGDRRSDGE